MKLFLDDLNMFNDPDTHSPKLWLCFILIKMWKTRYKLEPWKIHVYRASKEGKLPHPKKVSGIVCMPASKTPKDILVFNGMA